MYPCQSYLLLDCESCILVSIKWECLAYAEGSGKKSHHKGSSSGADKRIQVLEIRRPGLGSQSCNLKTLWPLSHDPSELHFTLQNRMAISMSWSLLGGLYWNYKWEHDCVLLSCPFCIFRKPTAPLHRMHSLNQVLWKALCMYQLSLALYNPMK